MVIAELELGDLLLTTLWIFFLFMFIWVFIAVLMDLFRDHSLSGGAKAVWVVGLILFPLIGCLVYLIARGPSMSKRAMAQAEAAQKDFDSYVRTTVGTSGNADVDDLTRLAALRDSGTISDEEFQSMKARVVGSGAAAPAAEAPAAAAPAAAAPAAEAPPESAPTPPPA
jgi:Phospholipase_D-nuclease N-terminal/Short C-terminal domain